MNTQTYCEAHGVNLVQNDGRCMLCENGVELMPVAVLEDTLAAQQEAREAMRAAKAEIESLREQRDTWHECFRSARRQHEHFVGELHRRFENTAARDELLLWDEMADMVRDAYLAIHGPSDGNAG